MKHWWKLQIVYEKLNTLLLLKGKAKKKRKKYSIFRSLQDMIFKDYWYFRILHWEIAKWNDEHHNRTKY